MNVIPDPQWGHLDEEDFTLPNGATRDNHWRQSPFRFFYSNILESCSLRQALIEGCRDLAAVSAVVEDPDRFNWIGRSPSTRLRVDQTQVPMGRP
jgi:hypothetical protein